MTFAGPVIPGGPPVELSGTAKEIYEQVLALNPSYTPWDFPDFQAEMAAKGVTRAEWESEFLRHNGTTPNTSIARRTNLDKRANFECNWGDWVRTWGDCLEGYDYLKALGSASCGAKGNTCSRTGNEYKMRCGAVADEIIKVADECGEHILGNRFYHVCGSLNYGGHRIGIKDQSC
ncbi:hypothetical protein OQA88_13470 [Cercophora sp. LCS_1]